MGMDIEENSDLLIDYLAELRERKKRFKKLFQNGLKYCKPQFNLWKQGEWSANSNNDQYKTVRQSKEYKNFLLWQHKYQKENIEYKILLNKISHYFTKTNSNVDVAEIEQSALNEKNRYYPDLQKKYEDNLGDTRVEIKRLQDKIKLIDESYQFFAKSREIYDVGGKLCSTIVGLPVGVGLLLLYNYLDICYTAYNRSQFFYHDYRLSQQKTLRQQIKSEFHENYKKDKEASVDIKFLQTFFKCCKYKNQCDPGQKVNENAVIPKIFLGNRNN